MSGKYELVNLESGKKSVLEARSGSVGPDCLNIGSINKDHGIFTFDPGFMATAACESKITYIDGDNGILPMTYLQQLASSGAESPDKEKALFLLGWVAYREEKFDEVIGHFEGFLDSYLTSPYRDESRYWMAWAHLRKKNYPKAIEELQRLIQENPRSPLVPSAFLKIGDAQYNLKRFGSATQSYQKVVKDYPKSKEAPEADFGIRLSYLQEKKYDLFVAQDESFLKRYPQHPGSRQPGVDPTGRLLPAEQNEGEGH